ncbi:CLUMA_CG006691, isoform A [Clunio marinus]|uniref:CLUMA_CG006691, isoform A n=1 Tax=Clunio marinus TaxID=568069 RepID=A0A1J1HYG5_9DIPT|nr:CLUMA_CG006691, isoform A [Clunio marinus]
MTTTRDHLVFTLEIEENENKIDEKTFRYFQLNSIFSSAKNGTGFKELISMRELEFNRLAPQQFCRAIQKESEHDDSNKRYQLMLEF